MVETPHRDRRVKKRLLRGLLDENVETIEGRPLGSMRRDRRRRLARLRRWLLTGAGAGAVGAGLGVFVWLGIGVDATATGPGSTTIEPPVVARYSAGSPAPVDPAVRARHLASSFASGEGRDLVPEVIPLAVRRIAIDPGHGGIDGGTSLGHGLLEKDLTGDIARRLALLFEKISCEVVLTRAEDSAVSLKDRAVIANAAHADLFVSIHVNWLPDRDARGVETYYLGPTQDPFLRRLTAAENRDSGYSLGDYRRLLEGIYADVRQEESRHLAESVQQALFQTLIQENPDIVSRGVMTAPFAVLVATEMPAILVEVACLSNDREARLLAIPSYRQRIAAALYGGISEYARSVNRPAIVAEKGN